MQSTFLGLFFFLFLLNSTLADALPLAPVSPGSMTAIQQSSQQMAVASASPSASVNIPCIRTDGSVANADASKICKAILPQCSDLKSLFETNAKNYLSMKFWGYYNGKDIDISNSTLDNLVGPAVGAPFCSVVGQTVKTSKTPPADAEINQPSMGTASSCGVRPKATYSKTKGVGIDLHFEQDQTTQWGTQWISYMNGAHLWAIRKAAYDVFDGPVTTGSPAPHSTGLTLAGDLSNMSQVFSTPSTATQLAQLMQQISKYISNLPTETQTACSATDSDLVHKCLAGLLTPSDPAQALCTLVKAQLAANTGAVGNLLVGEVISRANTLYQAKVANIFSSSPPNTRYEGLKNHCNRYILDNSRSLLVSPWQEWNGKPVTENLAAACTASCFFNGNEMHANAKARTVDPGGGDWALTCKLPDQGGFASTMADIIRYDICGQKSPSDDNDCDRAAIPSKPTGAK